MIVFLAVSILMLQGKPNPEYGWWKDAPVGAWVKFDATMKMAAGTATSERVLKVASTTPEKITIERTGTVLAGGNKQALPPKVTEIPAMHGPPLVVEKEYPQKLDIKGKPVECVVIEGFHTVDGEKRPVKYWLSKEIPGRIARSESRSEAAQADLVQVALDWGQK